MSLDFEQLASKIGQFVQGRKCLVLRGEDVSPETSRLVYEAARETLEGLYEKGYRLPFQVIAVTTDVVEEELPSGESYFGCGRYGGRWKGIVGLSAILEGSIRESTEWNNMMGEEETSFDEGIRRAVREELVHAALYPDSISHDPFNSFDEYRTFPPEIEAADLIKKLDEKLL